MPLQTIFSSQTGADSELEVPAFVTIVGAIVWGWLLVSVWQRVLENFSFETLGLNSRYTVHALIIALIMSISFFAFIWMVDRYEIVPAGTAAGSVAGATEGLINTVGGNGSTSAVVGQLANTRLGHPIVLGRGLNFF